MTIRSKLDCINQLAGRFFLGAFQAFGNIFLLFLAVMPGKKQWNELGMFSGIWKLYRTQDQQSKILANNQIENCPENVEFRLILENESSWHLVLKNFSLSCFGKSQNFMLKCQFGLSCTAASSIRLFAFECWPEFLIVDPKYGSVQFVGTKSQLSNIEH